MRYAGGHVSDSSCRDSGATYRPELSGLLSDRASDGRALHFTLGVDDLHVVSPCPMPDSLCATHHTSVVLEVQEDTVASPPGLALADNDGGHDLLSELRLSLLDGGHDHVTDTTGGQTVKTSTDTLDGDDVEVTGAGVVAAVHDRTAVSSQFTSFNISNRQVRHRCTIFEEREGVVGQTYTGRPRVILSLLPCVSVRNLLCHHVARQLVIAVVETGRMQQMPGRKNIRRNRDRAWKPLYRITER